MLRERQKLIDKIGVTISGIIILVSFVFCYLAVGMLFPGRLVPFDEYFGAIGAFIVIVFLNMLVKGVSASRRFIHPAGILWELTVCYALGILGYGFFTYLFKAPHLSRVYILSSVLFSYVAVSVFYLFHSLLYKELRVRGFNFQNVLLVGNKYSLPQFIETIKDNKALGLNIVGIMTLEELDSKEFMGYKYFGNLDHMRRVLNSEVIDYAVFTVYRQDPQIIEKAMLICQERGIDVWMKPDFMQKMTLSRVDYLEDIPLFIFSLGPKSELALMVKRLADIVISFLLLVFLALPMLVITIMIKNTSKGPALFKQKRVGLNGRRFIVYKFRTMYSDIKQRKSEYSLKNEMKGPVFKMKKDPRITPVGQFLRKYSLDELPQFWNVFIGHMSLVGPRPPLPTEVSLYKGWQRRRLSMRPGLTCIWQVAGRNKIYDFDEWAKLDLQYIDTWSLLLDFVIFVKTIPTVLKGTGC